MLVFSSLRTSSMRIDTNKIYSPFIVPRFLSDWLKWNLNPKESDPRKIEEQITETFLKPKNKDLRYNPRLYSGGLLPRPEYYDEPVNMPEYRPKDKWAPHRATFGQNDYIDILGNDNLSPRDFYTGPLHALNAKTEHQMICQILNDPTALAWFEEHEPTRLNLMRKRQKHLFKYSNRRRNIKYPHFRDKP